MQLKATRLIRDVPDFPIDGIIFKDVTPILHDPEAFEELIERLREAAAEMEPDLVAGIESRGFIFGAPLALALGCPFAPVRKLGKLPAATVQVEYALEYGTNTLEMHRDAVIPGQRVVIVDDLLATGGTARAAAELVQQLGGVLAGMVFAVELGFLNGRDALPGHRIRSLIHF